VLLEEKIDRVDGGLEPFLEDPKRMRALGHEDELVADPVSVQTLAKVDVADLGAVELAVDEEVGWRMLADVGEGRGLLVYCLVLRGQVATEKIDD
jgi:hypothetical protein